MSDPIKKNEAEDVLSSIRRLVSAGQASSGEDAAGKLVLASAQRVDMDSDDDQLSETLERRIAELEAAVTAQRGEFEPDGSESNDRETPHGIDHLAAAKRIVAQIRHEDDSPEVMLERAKADTPPAPQTADDISASAPVAASVAGPEGTPKVARLGAAKPAQPDARSEPRTAIKRPEERPAAAAIGNARGASSADENLLDDPALRDLISTIVREELQGELGERITRSARKLVRREIQTALAARDFD